jgi:hypothetical protein
MAAGCSELLLDASIFMRAGRGEATTSQASSTLLPSPSKIRGCVRTAFCKVIQDVNAYTPFSNHTSRHIYICASFCNRRAKAVHLVSPETADDESHLSTHPTQLLPCALTPSPHPTPGLSICTLPIAACAYARITLLSCTMYCTS